jgi:hypothetical protein
MDAFAKCIEAHRADLRLWAYVVPRVSPDALRKAEKRLAKMKTQEECESWHFWDPASPFGKHCRPTMWGGIPGWSCDP